MLYIRSYGSVKCRSFSCQAGGREFDGLWTQWYESGQKRIEGNYRNGEHTDIWTSWDSLGVEHSASDWFQKGNNAEEYDKKISFYLRAIELDPDFALAYYKLGNADYKQGNLTKAIELYEKAIELNPDYPEAYNNLGSAYYNQGNPELRLSNYKKAARLGEKTVQDWLKKNGHDW